MARVSMECIHLMCSENGVFANMRKGALLVDTSTIDPLTTKQLAKDAQSHGATWLDAPVSGGDFRFIHRS